MIFFRNENVIPHLKPLSNRRPVIVTVLDVGTSKLCCLIARLIPKDDSELLTLSHRTHQIEIIGFSHQKSSGIKNGVIVDLVKAEQSVRRCIDVAERMAGVTVGSLIVNISSGCITSEAFTAHVVLDGHEIQDRDISRVLHAGAQTIPTNKRTVIHAIPIGYKVDSNKDILDPRGMFGDSLGVNMHVVSAECNPIRNLELCLNRAHLSVACMVVTPYASGLATLVDDETKMGCICIDMGAGTTTFSVFSEEKLIYCDVIAIGGNHVTMDLARGLSVRLEDAEKLKVLQGSVLTGVSDDQEMITVPPISADECDLPNQIPRAHLTRIIRPRIEEILELLLDRLNQSGFAGVIGKRLVLTGGGSQLNGVSEITRRTLARNARNIRIGRPMGVSGLSAAIRGPAFSTAVGLLVYPQQAANENLFYRSRITKNNRSYGRLSQVGNWLRESI